MSTLEISMSPLAGHAPSSESGPAARKVFVTGATGYLGSRLVPVLLKRGHTVAVLVRGDATGRVAAGARVVAGEALRPESFAGQIGDADTLVHLVGVAHPSPRKAREFETVDLASVAAMLEAIRGSGIAHVVYVSVAQPAPAMRAYVAARARGEALIGATRIGSSFVRPWYVLGPGHRWPLLLKPWYALAELIPATRDQALSLGLVTIDEMIGTLVSCVESPCDGRRIVDVPQIRRLGSAARKEVEQHGR